MKLTEILKKRRSIRAYKDVRLKKEDIISILEAGLLAPSSKGIFPVEMIVVEDRDMLKKLSVVKAGGGKHLEGAACGIVVIADARKADAWVEDTSIALANMMLMAEDLGIGSCWTQIRLRRSAEGRDAGEVIRELLSIPEYYEVEAVLSLGIPADPRPPKEVRAEDSPKVHLNGTF